MNLDHFLDFWSRYNQTIIQALIVVTLIFIVALVFITLFGSKNDDATAGGPQVGLSPELEKSLQKMLENQTKAAVFDFSKAQENKAPSSIATQPDVVSAEVTAQMETLKSEMAAKEKKIQDLNTQLSQALSQTTKELKVDSSGFDSRIKELEARLAEYDIISEDIADLSRYKDENEKLKSELESLRSGGAPAPAPAQAMQAPDLESVAATAPITPEPVVDESDDEMIMPSNIPPVAATPDLQVVSEEDAIIPVTAASSIEAAPAAAAPPVESAPAASAVEPDPAVSAAIDDDLMKEFAAAVEGQKAATQAANLPPPGSDNEDLMGQFENFVQKKEGS